MTARNIRQNLFFAFAYNIVGIPIAAGVLYPIIGLPEPDDRGRGHGVQLAACGDERQSPPPLPLAAIG